MYEIVRYSEKEFEDLFKKINNLESKIYFWMDKTNKKVNVETQIYYNNIDNMWEGELEVTNEKGDR
jgi:hypothetical protein